MSGNRLFDAFSGIMTYIIKCFKWVVVAAVILVLLSGIYRVESNEVAVVLRFGKLVGETQEEQIKKPGLHFAFPFFIDEVIKVPVQTVHEKEITTHYGLDGRILADVRYNGYLLTGDNNTILIRLKVKYTIGDTVRYALYSCDADSVIDGVLSGELTRHVSKITIDEVMTTSKATLPKELMETAQAMLDELGTGIVISNVELTEIVPPTQVIGMFNLVTDAAVQYETTLQLARDIANTAKIEAESTASKAIEQANVRQAEKVAAAKSEMSEFYGVLEQYKKNPEVIINGTYSQRIAEILKKSGGVIYVSEDGAPPKLILP